MKLSPLDIRKYQFKKAFRGYDPVDVKAFVEEIARQWEEVYDEQRHHEDRVRELEHKLKHYERVELALQEALESARETGRRAEAAADQKAKLIVEEAELRALRIVQDADQERYHLRQDLVKLTHRQNEVAARLRAFLMSELEILAQFQGDDPVGFIKLVPAGEHAAGELAGRPRRALAGAAPEAEGEGPEAPAPEASAQDVAPLEGPAVEAAPDAPPPGDTEATYEIAPVDVEPEPAPVAEAPAPEPDAIEPEPAEIEPVATATATLADADPAPAEPEGAGEGAERFDMAEWFQRYASEEDRREVEAAEPAGPEPAEAMEAPAFDAPEPEAAGTEEADEAPAGPRPLHEVLAEALRGGAAPGGAPPGTPTDAPSVWERYTAVPDDAEPGAGPEGEGAPASDPFANAFYNSPFFREATPPPAPGPAPGSDAAQGWSLRSIVTGEPEPEAAPPASPDEREKIRRLLEDLD
jgi:cell division initiation protein